MWAACLENHALLRAFTTACRGHSQSHTQRGMCRAFGRMPEAPPSADLDSPNVVNVGAELAGEDEPSWVKRGFISLWPPIVPPR